MRADHGQMEQVIMNLAVNARDAMPRGGVIRIATGATPLDAEAAERVGAARPGAYATLAFSDSGVGMDEQTLEHVFEPFFTTKEVGRGTGLGLSIVYGIVKQHGGGIDVASPPRARVRPSRSTCRGSRRNRTAAPDEAPTRARRRRWGAAKRS